MDAFATATFGSLFVTLFVIMDPPGTIPIFLALTSNRTLHMQHRMAWQASAVAFGVLSLFALLGRQILGYLHVSVPALQVSGGLLLLLIALDLLTGRVEEPTGSGDVNVALVPLGTPLLAGPGAIVAVVLAMQKAHSDGEVAAVWTALLVIHVLLWITMRYSLYVIRLIKDGGVVLVTRLSGLLLAAIAVQLVADGVFTFVDHG